MTTAPKRAKAKGVHRESDSDLVKRCLKGEETAWAELIDKYKNLIFSIPIRYGYSEEDSADIFQSVCMDLLAELSSLREPQALAAWLIQVARNKCFHRRQALRTYKVQGVDDLDSHTASIDEPVDLVAQVQQAQLLLEALSNLSSQCQQLVRMLFFEVPPRPYEDVAKELKLAQGSIGFTRRNCLEKLRKQLQSLGY
jgi:RNA polymerase sigma factor (sigma-70 family)